MMKILCNTCAWPCGKKQKKHVKSELQRNAASKTKAKIKLLLLGAAESGTDGDFDLSSLQKFTDSFFQRQIDNHKANEDHKHVEIINATHATSSNTPHKVQH
jgi:hypothetical protein